MNIPNDAAILMRAKEYCNENGTAWSVLETANNLVHCEMRVLDDRDRRRYLARAREQLLIEYMDA